MAKMELYIPILYNLYISNYHRSMSNLLSLNRNSRAGLFIPVGRRTKSDKANEASAAQF